MDMHIKFPRGIGGNLPVILVRLFIRGHKGDRDSRCFIRYRLSPVVLKKYMHHGSEDKTDGYLSVFNKNCKMVERHLPGTG
jgi:hypothetical protein